MEYPKICTNSLVKDLTKYERTSLVSKRIHELELNARPLIEVNEKYSTLYEHSLRELDACVLTHLAVIRQTPAERNLVVSKSNIVSGNGEG